MQLSSGDRVYGHVRRYFPHHNLAQSRIDVGRRSERAMVILTRALGGNAFYNSLLKTMDVISSHYHIQMNTPSEDPSAPKHKPLKNQFERFLHQVHAEHSQLASSFQNSLTASPNSPTPSLITIGLKQIEINNEHFANVDMTKFIMPTSIMLLQQMQKQQTQSISSSSDSLILPLLRCLGIAHTLRLLSALLCERRIILVSSSTTKLTTCINSLTSILSQGCLSWQHIFVPILPPSMFNFLAAPMPYLIGLMSHYGSPQQLEKIAGLGEVLAVYLDNNDFKTFGINNPDLFIPEILSNENQIGAAGMDPMSQQYGYGHPNMQQQTQYSIADTLKIDLLMIMKEDKKARNTSASTSGGTGAVAARGKDLLKKGFGKLKDVAKKVGNIEPSRSYENGSSHGGGVDPPGNESAIADPVKNELYAYNEGYSNELWEEEVRIAFTVFFLSYIGDMKGYLRPKSQGTPGPPSFDKELFKASRIKAGEYENSPMFKLTTHFKESQIFEQFANARVDDVSQRRTFSPRISPLFVLALQYHNSKRIPFRSNEVRSVVKNLARNRPVQELIHGVSHVRAKAVSLTSNSRNEATAQSTLHRLVLESRESSVILVEVMSVVWDRIRDSRGMQWKHGLFALQIIQELLLHGPLAAVTEATDGLDKIRRMKTYENARTIAVQEIRATARFVYSLLINRGRLFAMRRICAQRRRELAKPIRYSRDSRFDLVSNRRLRMSLVKFKKLHSLIKPGGVAGSAVDLLGVEMSTSAPPSGQQSAPSIATEISELSQIMQNAPPISAPVPTNASPINAPAPTYVPSINAPVSTSPNMPPNAPATAAPILTSPAPTSHEPGNFQNPVVAHTSPINQSNVQSPEHMNAGNVPFQQPSVSIAPPPMSPNNQGLTQQSTMPMQTQVTQQGFASQRSVNSPSSIPHAQQNFLLSQQQPPLSPSQYINPMYHQQQQQKAPPEYMYQPNYQVGQHANQMNTQPQSQTATITPKKTKPSSQFDPFA